MKLFLLGSFLLLGACSLINQSNQAEVVYLQAHSLPALKVPKRLQKTTYLQPSFNIPPGKLARGNSYKVSDYPPQRVKV